jgi:hypothetical protein
MMRLNQAKILPMRRRSCRHRRIDPLFLHRHRLHNLLILIQMPMMMMMMLNKTMPNSRSQSRALHPSLPLSESTLKLLILA